MAANLVEEDATQGTRARPAVRWWRWAGVGVFILLIVGLFDAYLHLSQTYAENSDEANILLMAHDMLHGNLYLSGWNVSDVPFITTELPEITLLVWLFGLHLETAHIAAAVTYTLVVAVAMLLAKGKARGWAAAARMALALGIMLAPQPGVGIFVVIFSVGHIGTSLPVMLTWLLLDRAGRRWWVPPAIAVLLAWAETADPLVLVIAIYPMLAVCLARLVASLAAAIRPDDSVTPDDSVIPNDSGASSIRARLSAAWSARWFEVALAVAAGMGYTISWLGGQLLRMAGGYVQQPVPYQFDSPGKWLMQSRVVVHGLLEMFGAYFVPGQQEPQTGLPAPGGLDQAIAYTHLAGVVLAIWGACAIARRFFRRDADIVSQLLLAGIVANICAYIPTTLADHSALNTREIAPVLPFAAVLAGRMLGERLLRAPMAGPLVRVRVGGRRLGVRVVCAALAVVMGWYGFGLWRQASTPAAPQPYARLVSYLEKNHLSYGVGGYWEASVITVESGGAVTIRAVTPGCIMPYKWESKTEWYDPSLHTADFLLLNNVPGYFSQFGVSSGTLLLLNRWYPGHRFYDTGGVIKISPKGNPIYAYEARWYPGANLLSITPRLKASLSKPAPWLLKELNGVPPAPCP